MDEFLAVSALPALEKFLQISTKKSISTEEISPFGLHNFITLPKLKKIGERLLKEQILGSFTDPKRRLKSQEEEESSYTKDLARMRKTNLRFVPPTQKRQIDRTAFEEEREEAERRLWKPQMFMQMEPHRWRMHSSLIDANKKLECEWKFTEVVTQLVFRLKLARIPPIKLVDTMPHASFFRDQEWESTKEKTYLEAFRLDFTEKLDVWHGQQIQRDLKEARMKQVSGKIIYDIQAQIELVGKKNAISCLKISQALSRNRKGNFALKPRSLKRIPITINKSVPVSTQPESAVKRLVSHMKTNAPKEKTAFPFKVGSLVVESPEEQYLLYHSKDINLKTLGKVFLTDRIRFHQNKVKIEIEQKDNSDRIASALQILVNLGADVSCLTTKQGARRYSDIKDIDILISAFLSQRPVGEVIQLYN